MPFAGAIPLRKAYAGLRRGMAPAEVNHPSAEDADMDELPAWQHLSGDTQEWDEDAEDDTTLGRNSRVRAILDAGSLPFDTVKFNRDFIDLWTPPVVCILIAIVYGAYYSSTSANYCPPSFDAMAADGTFLPGGKHPRLPCNVDAAHPPIPKIN